MRVKLLFLFLFLTTNIIKGQTLDEAQYFLDRSDYKKAIALFDIIKERAVKQNNVFEIVLAANGIADCYTDLGAYHKSLSILKENLRLLNSSKTKNYKLLAETHLLLAHNYDNLFFFEEYLSHSHQYYYNIKKAFPKKEIYKALYYTCLGRYNNVKLQMDQAEFYTSNALKIYHRNKADKNLIDVYKLYNAHTFTIRNRGGLLSDKLKYVDTLNFYLNKRYPHNNVKKSRLLVSATMLYFDTAYNLSMGNDPKSKFYREKTIDVLNNSLNTNNKLIGFYYDVSAKNNGLKNLLYLAAKDFQKALEECNIGIKRVSDKDILNLGFASNNYHIITLLRQKHLVLDELNKSNPKKELQLQIIDNLLLMEKIWDRYSQDQVNVNADFMTSMYNQNPYSFLFQAYLQLFEITKDKKYIEKIHEYDEKSKYSSLLLTASLSPKQKEEKQLLYNKRQEIYLIYNDYVLAKNNQLQSQFALKKELLQLIKQYNRTENNTDLFQQSKIITIKEIQKDLPSNEAIISYIRGEITSTGILYAKIITKNNVTIINLIRESKLWTTYYKHEIDTLTKSLQHHNLKDYYRISGKIYKDVFEKIEQLLPAEITHIQIIPNAELSNLPFDLLLYKDSKTNDFRKLPYLIRKYNFSYSLSSSITKINNTKRRKLFEKMVFFSPTFNKQHLSQLEFSKAKAKAISETYNATFVEGQMASLQEFKAVLQDSKIISVFSHGQSFDDFENDKKGIYFTDGFLNLNDVYNMKSNCDFLILGACETGLGVKDNGEGNISLVRPFSSIGVKSMLLASWKIDEEATMEITESFFKYLVGGYSKSEALQKAKLDFLKTADPRTANPYYWAGLNIVGNNEPIKLSETNYLWSLVFIFPIAGGLWYFRKRRKKKKSVT